MNNILTICFNGFLKDLNMTVKPNKVYKELDEDKENFTKIRG